MALYVLNPNKKYCKYIYRAAVDCEADPPVWVHLSAEKEFSPCDECTVADEYDWQFISTGKDNCVAEKVVCVGECDPNCCPDPPSTDLPTLDIPSECCGAGRCFQVYVATYDPVSEVWSEPSLFEYRCIPDEELCPPEDILTLIATAPWNESGADPSSDPWLDGEWSFIPGTCHAVIYFCQEAGCTEDSDCAEPLPPSPPSGPPPTCDCNADMEQYECQTSGFNCGNLKQQPTYDSDPASGPGIVYYEELNVVRTSITARFAFLGCQPRQLMWGYVFQYVDHNDNPTGNFIVWSMYIGTDRDHFWSYSESGAFDGGGKRYIIDVFSLWPVGAPTGEFQLKGDIEFS